MYLTRISLLGLLAGLVFFATLRAEDTTPMQPRFETDVRPILKAMCFQCHGEEEDMSGGLDLRLVRLMQQGGDSGAAIDGHDPDESLLWQRIADDEMPEGAKKLTPDEKQTIRRWIEAGSPTVRPEPEQVEAAKYTPEELNFWSFQPVVEVEVPEVRNAIVRNPIDAFVVAKLQDTGLEQSPEANRATLLRRVTFDLTGLPPTVDELQRFLADRTSDAYEQVVERLLASEAYGLRWGRHWLDIAGYSETEGHLADDVHRPDAWRYRDYVIDSLNADKPYDVFLQEQLAGDELILMSATSDASPQANAAADGTNAEGTEPAPDNPRHVELLTATGFLRMGPDLTGKQNTLLDRNQAVAETMKIVASATIGLTVGCAQCHDHRYDPISAEDYYRFRAVFDPAFSLEHWQQPEQRSVDMTDSETQAEIDRIDAVAQQQEAELESRRQKLGEEIYAKLVNELPETDRASLIAAIGKNEADLQEAEVELLKKNPMFKPAGEIAKRLAVYDTAAHNKFFEEEKKIKAIRDSGPARRRVMCVHETDKAIPESAVFARGDPMSPKEKVSPGEIFVLARNRETKEIPVDAMDLPSTGRRLAYARQLTDGTHPTVARVAVNRMWMHHFGSGLVSTASDFGLAGERPSHPELLDWLASEFVRGGWRMKRLHKIIVMSHAFRQASTRRGDDIDAENRLLSRMSLRRLEAEEIRDAMLVATGMLKARDGGPSVPVAMEADGRVVIGKTVLNGGGLFDHVEDLGDSKYCRSVYLSNERISPLTMLDTFDAPAMMPNCDMRKSSTVAPQALWFLNDQIILDQTDNYARRTMQDVSLDANGQVDEAIRREVLTLLWAHIYSAEPTHTELEICTDYLNRQCEQLRQVTDLDWVARVKEDPKAVETAALASLCQSLFSTNRFLYVD